LKGMPRMRKWWWPWSSSSRSWTMDRGGGRWRDEVDRTGAARTERSHGHPIPRGIDHHGAIEVGAHQDGARFHVTFDHCVRRKMKIIQISVRDDRSLRMHGRNECRRRGTRAAMMRHLEYRRVKIAAVRDHRALAGRL